MNSLDLHMHSCYSNDGEFTPQGLIRITDAAHLTAIALSDHNTSRRIADMVRLEEVKGIRVVLAMEFDTLFEGLEVYVLDYGIDYEQPYFQNLFDSLSERRQTVQIKRVKKVRKVFDPDIDPATLLKRYTGKNPLPAVVHHIMEQHGDEEEFTDYQSGGGCYKPQPVDFYWDVCSAGKPYHIRVECPSLRDTVQRIHDARGIAVLIHPWLNLYQKEERLQKTLDEGIDGIEAHSNHYEAKHNRYYDTYCHRHGILMTCGGDSHGKMKPKIQVREYGYEKDGNGDILQAFLKRLAEQKSVYGRRPILTGI